MSLPSSLRPAAAFVALATALPACLLVDGLTGLSGASAGDGGGGSDGSGSGGGEAGGARDAGDAGPGPDVQDAPASEVGPGDAAGGAPVDATDAGPDAAEAGPLSYAATVLSDGPIAYWRMGDTTKATAKDSSGNGHDGSYQGGVTLGVPGAIAGDPDTAAQFDGNSGQMTANVPGSFDFAGNVPYSIEVWARPTADPAGMGIVGKSAYAMDAGGYFGWYVANNSNGYLDGWRNNDDTGNPAPAAGSFVHIVATYDGTNLALYVNAQPFASSASQTPLPATGAPLTAGAVAYWGMFTGVLDEIAVYDKVLLPERITAHYARGTGQ